MTTQTKSPAQEAGIDRGLIQLAVVVVLGAIMTILDTTIVNVALPTLGKDFDASLSSIQWVATGYLLALSMAIPLTGWAVQRFGSRTMWLISLGLFIGGSLLCGMAWDVTSLVAFRIVQGLGGGMIMPVGQTMLARAAGPDRMGRVMSIVSIPAMLGPVLGPLLGGVIVDNLSWRWMFYVNVPLCAVALIAAVRLLPRDTERNAEARLDFVGMALLCPGLAALVYGLSEAGEGGDLSNPRFLAGSIAGAVLVAAFVVHALRRRENALIDIRLVRSRAWTTSTAGLFFYSGAMFGLMMLVPLYGSVVRGDSALRAGMLLSPLGVGAAIAMSLAGKLSDRYGARRLAPIGLVVILAGILLLTTIDAGTGRTLVMGAMFLIGIGHGVMAPSLMAASYQGLPRASIPSATTGSNVLLRVGGSFGVAAIAVILQLAIQDHVPGASGNLKEAAAQQTAQTPAQLTAAVTDTVWWAAAIAALALIPLLLLPSKIRPKNEDQ
ncbi:DHA2 family efflux MFS transporter permease subunit [Actinomadura barringtoniae]|uniref:DHA2 family efflux MFS transporter permease subunit n=1 Tax=Actinomadura barringtoniae TaxID=1427535 RepID=A0A939PEX2_9ACTN|nr:DHA2 family efflux MFS transporter permease subunit [Actinomadura barringtoniae]MBO2451587.1 DHA2 family efflux MFS transporter permease subunit [Actinomadura barringtoniae]